MIANKYFTFDQLQYVYVCIYLYIKYVYQKWFSFRQTSSKGINIFKPTYCISFYLVPFSLSLLYYIIEQVIIMYFSLKSTFDVGFFFRRTEFFSFCIIPLASFLYY